MAKLSGLCKTTTEHIACPEWLFDASGKRFKCMCECHIKVEPSEDAVDNEDDFDDDE